VVAKLPIPPCNCEPVDLANPRAKLIGDRPVQIDRYKGKTITDRATANSPGQLKTKVATLRQNAQLKLLEPPLT